jgi:sarcosine oxidase, subunit beta
MWPRLEEELGADMHYRQVGHITLAEREEDVSSLADWVDDQRQRGLSIEMVYGDDLRQIAPAIGPQFLAGSYCPTDGHANPYRSTRAFVNAAQRAGARILTDTAVTGIETEGGRISGVETSGGNLACDWVLNAAGAWASDLSMWLGLRIPVRPRAPQMMVTRPYEHVLDPVLGCLGRKLSLKQLPGGEFLIGGGWPGIPDLPRDTCFVQPASVQGSARDVSAVLPATAKLSVVRAWAGLEANSIDDMPILGPVPGIDGYLLATGFSGHGFCLAPHVGVMARRWITGEPTPEADSLSIRRFEGLQESRLQQFLADQSGGVSVGTLPPVRAGGKSR